MESTYALDTNHDLHIVNGQIARVSASDAILQTVKTRLLLIYQEWFLDLAKGLPCLTQMLAHRFHLYKIRSYVARQILSTNGVDELLELTLQIEGGAERKLVIAFEYRDVYGATIRETI